MGMSKIFLFFHLILFINLLKKCLSSERKGLRHSMKVLSSPENLGDTLSNTSQEELSDNCNSEQDKNLESNNKCIRSEPSCLQDNMSELMDKSDDSKEDFEELNSNEDSKSYDAMCLEDFCYSSCESLNELIDENNKSQRCYRKKLEISEKSYNNDSSTSSNKEYPSWDPLQSLLEEMGYSHDEEKTKVKIKESENDDASYCSFLDESDNLENKHENTHTLSNPLKSISDNARKLLSKNVSCDSDSSSYSDPNKISSENVKEMGELSDAFGNFNPLCDYTSFLKSHGLSDSTLKEPKGDPEPFSLDCNYFRIVDSNNFKFFILKNLYENFKILDIKDKIKLLINIIDIYNFIKKLARINFVCLTYKEEEEAAVDGAFLLDLVLKKEME
ncbi:sporozoite invasion-associated protein 2, putative [Plasmodium gallinaceum]|uniref:Sporozoite invasion-associated protein 2, putative n=1 Tax=Plasmodium gallinaceum TaxID=5849 RepID=A0A1J1GTC6_PLAGA|nr:sporozoite invasion-associated protein 2, putative [Plasmodium gallinaceum]CRG95482.1 sporozoite invasion-associated protein 2, putative [Plasmodium gallinaceum]